jgi:hypothetical protein
MAADAVISTSLRDSKACGTPAQIDNLGLPGAQIIRPGAPESSVLLLRMGATDARRMPQVGSRVVDSQATALIGDFIRSLTVCP